jgi:hypothetical protein
MDVKSRRNWKKIIFYQKVSSMVAGVPRRVNVDGSPMFFDRQLQLGRVIWVRRKAQKWLELKRKADSISSYDFGQLLLVQISAICILPDSVKDSEVA